MKVEWEEETLGGWEKREKEMLTEEVAAFVDELLHQTNVNYIRIYSGVWLPEKPTYDIAQHVNAHLKSENPEE